MNFTWDALEGAERTLRSIAFDVAQQVHVVDESLVAKAKEHLRNDIDTPAVISLVPSTNTSTKLCLLDLLGIDISFYVDKAKKAFQHPIPKEVAQLCQERDEARTDKDWARADFLREHILNIGYIVMDTNGKTDVLPSLSKVFD